MPCYRDRNGHVSQNALAACSLICCSNMCLAAGRVLLVMGGSF
jgi:hypothetical protein